MMDPRNSLAIPAIYTLFQRLVRGPGERAFVENHLRPQPGLRILDVGCGTGDILRHLPDIDYVGFDENPRAIESARKTYGHRGTFFCQRINEEVIRESGAFDIVVATGVLHHLNDEDAEAMFRLSRRALKPGCRLVTLDGCFAEGQSRAARLMLSLDRGKFVRTPQEYVRLATEVFSNVQPVVYDDLLRIPSSMIVMECSN